MFNLADWSGGQRRTCSLQGDVDRMTILSHGDPAEEQTIFARAQHVWRDVFGHVRKSKTRLRGWKRKPPARTIETEAGWKRQRDRFVQRSAETGGQKAMGEILIDAREKATATWTATHDKEVDLQKNDRNFGWSRQPMMVC